MAARRSPEQLKEEGRAFERQIADARKRTLSFAWLIGKDGLFLETDPKKGPEVLWRAAKKNGGGSKGASGRISVAGKTISLVCDNDDVPAQLPNIARRFLSERGLVYDIVLITPGTSTGEAGGDAAAPGEAGARDGLVRDLEGLAGRLQLAARSRNPDAARKVAALEQMARAQIDTDPKKARAVIALLAVKSEDAIAFGLQDSPAAGRRIGRLTGLEARIDGLLAQFA